MKKVLKISLLAILPALMLAGNANANCAEGLDALTWDKTASGYCKIFFPDCTENALGKRLSYSREVEPTELVCVGTGGEYVGYYKITIADANTVFKTEFERMGVNYTDELSKWLMDNCRDYCGKTVEVADSVEPVEPVVDAE